MQDRKGFFRQLSAVGLLLLYIVTAFSMEIILPKQFNSELDFDQSFIQIRDETFRAGYLSFRAWRIYANDLVEAAHWDGQGRLLRHTQTAILSPGLFSRIDKLYQSDQQPPVTSNIILGRSARTITISRFSDAGTQSYFKNKIDADLELIIDDLIALCGAMVSPAVGDYLWSEPMSPISIDKPTIDLSVNNESSVANILLRTLESGQLLQPLEVDQVNDVITVFHTKAIPISVKTVSGWFLIGHLITGE